MGSKSRTTGRSRLRAFMNFRSKELRPNLPSDNKEPVARGEIGPIPAGRTLSTLFRAFLRPFHPVDLPSIHAAQANSESLFQCFDQGLAEPCWRWRDRYAGSLHGGDL